MKKVFYELGLLDQNCYKTFALSEEILMEHASNGLNRYIRKKFKLNSKILIICGTGNNGGDGYTLARLLAYDYNVRVYIHKKPKTAIAKRQLERCEKVGVHFTENLESCDVLVDALFGSGFSGALRDEDATLLGLMNDLKAYKIACDVPSALSKEGKVSCYTFRADITISMGALKTAFYSDAAKEVIGKVKVVDLGVSPSLYEGESDTFLLQKSDLKLPHRKQKNSHKGTYGHTAVIAGEKSGAAIMSALSAFSFGSGLVTVVGNHEFSCPYELMHSNAIPKNTTAIAFGMGLGENYTYEDLQTLLYNSIPTVIDADAFSSEIFLGLLSQKKELVLTPHPKEFTTILRLCRLGEFSTQEVQEKRFELARRFSQKYPSTVLVLKGANTLIAHQSSIYINSFGGNALAKGGSGDVLAGLIAALLAQGYDSLSAAISGSLAQTLGAQKIKKRSFALTPSDIIKGVTCL